MKKLLMFWNKCSTCGESFTTPSDPNDYSVRILLSRATHSPAWVDCDSRFFKEVSQIVDEVLTESTPVTKRAEAFDNVFGDICDLADDGTCYDMSGKRFCPLCGSEVRAYGPATPPRYLLTSPTQVSHKKWDSLSACQKKKWIAALMLENGNAERRV